MTKPHSPARALCRALLASMAFAGGSVTAGQPTPTELMDWAERAYPLYFPGPGANQVSGTYIYRFYPSTGNYVPDGQCELPHLWPPQIPPGKDRRIMQARG